MRPTTMAQHLRVRNAQHAWKVREFMAEARKATGRDRREWVRLARITNTAIVHNQRRIAAYDPPATNPAVDPQIALL